jgi:elongation factor G
VSQSHTQDRPVISVAISPRSSDDREKFQRALSDLAEQDPTIRINTEPIVGQAIISGMGELHLEVICDRILHEYKIHLDVSKPKVLYVETIRKQAEAEGKYIRQTGGRGQYAHVKLRLEPRELGSDYQFVNETREGAVLPEFVAPINFGIQEAMKGGILAGYEMVDLRAVLYDGSYHVADSNEMAFKIAASMAFKEAARKASPVLMEPVMSVQVVTPEDLAGSIIGDLSLRRGRIERMESRAGSQVITAIVPLAEMLGYATHMRLSTQGRFEYSMHFAHYEAAPRTGESGADEAGVTANRPKRPKAGSGFAAAKLDAESE